MNDRQKDTDRPANCDGTDAGAKRLLLVEDDRALAELIQDFLQNEGYDITTERRGDVAAQRIVEESPDLVILDINLPGLNGFDVCRQVRGEYNGMVMMFTARDDDIDHILGLEMGADDYVEKPVKPRVLQARIRALFRRQSPYSADAPTGTDTQHLQYGGLVVDSAARRVTLDDQLVELTTMEFDLLWQFASQPGATLSRDVLFQALRGLEYDGLDRSIDIGVSRLRKKLADTENPATRIKTVRGRGYLFVADAW